MDCDINLQTVLNPTKFHKFIMQLQLYFFDIEIGENKYKNKLGKQIEGLFEILQNVPQSLVQFNKVQLQKIFNRLDLLELMCFNLGNDDHVLRGTPEYDVLAKYIEKLIITINQSLSLTRLLIEIEQLRIE